MNPEPSGGIGSNSATHIALTAKIAAFVSKISASTAIVLVAIVATVVVITSIAAPLGILLPRRSGKPLLFC